MYLVTEERITVCGITHGLSDWSLIRTEACWHRLSIFTYVEHLFCHMVLKTAYKTFESTNKFITCPLGLTVPPLEPWGILENIGLCCMWQLHFS